MFNINKIEYFKILRNNNCMQLILKSSILIIFFLLSLNSLSNNLPQPVETKLIIDTKDIRSKNSFKLGVLFKINPKWHIYWKNPGDSGLSTNIIIKVPEEFQMSEQLWPYPKSFKGTSGIDYGYENEVLIWTEIKTPKNINLNIPIYIEANWLSCKEICIPGKIIYEQELAYNKNYNNEKMFRKWGEFIPKNKINGINYKISTKHTKDNTSTVFEININSKKNIMNIELFPLPSNEIKIENIEYKKINDTSYLTSIYASLYKGQK
ncbi:MAG: hypothetical protein GTN59_12610, partial [Candidatus Dadabacteria bacterium]|nr:hypothetical protein [Candidatus Dadabacteria bacterium]